MGEAASRSRAGIANTNSEFCGLRQLLSVHPRFRLNFHCPVLKTGYAPQILPNMLLADIPDRDIFSVPVTDRDAEYPFGQKDSFCMMTQRAMAKIRQHGFRLVKPLVDGQVVFGGTAELSRTVLRVLQGMGHDSNLPRIGGIADDFIPVVFDTNLTKLKVEGNRAVSTFAVLISFGCKTF
jgi:hypothetical protein